MIIYSKDDYHYYPNENYILCFHVYFNLQILLIIQTFISQTWLPRQHWVVDPRIPDNDDWILVSRVVITFSARYPEVTKAFIQANIANNPH